MASGHVNRANRPNTRLHRPTLLREESSCQLGAVHTRGQSGKHMLDVSFSHFDPERTCTDLSIHGRRARSESSQLKVHKLRPHTSSHRARLHSPENPPHSESRKIWPSASNRKEQTFSSIASDPGPAGRHRAIQSCPCSASIVAP